MVFLSLIKLLLKLFMSFVSITLGVLVVVVAFVADDVVSVAGVFVIGSATLNGAVTRRNIIASNKKFVVVVVVVDVDVVVDEKVIVVESIVLSTTSVCLDLLLMMIELLGL